MACQHSMHNILFHGVDIINHVSLPIGMTSEETQESRNKDQRNFREQHTRKKFKKKAQWKIWCIHFSSDPLISSGSKRPTLYSRNQIIVDNDVQNLLLEQNVQEDAVCSYNSD